MMRLLTIIVLMVTVFLSGCASTWSSDSAVSTKVEIGSKKAKRTYRPRSVNIDTQDISKVMDDSNDLWSRVRDGLGMEDPDMPLTIQHARQLSSNPEYVNRLLQRSSYYLFYIVEEVEARDMPSELALLPFVESAFNPRAVSPAKASGMWQFMPATGKDYKLTQNMFRDERRDIIHSTRAALDYLQRLYKMFGDWHLALAAYNWGEGSVARAIKRNQALGLPTDYFSLKMPNETRNYVPKLLAYKRVVENPKAYGFNLPKVENHPYFLAVKVNRDIDVDLAIQLSGISKDQFISLNPSFTKPVILSAASPQILLPFGKAEIFQDNLKKYDKPLSSWTAVQVERTDTVEGVAANLDVDAQQLRDLNGIPRGMRIKGGSTILVPKGSRFNGDVPTHLADNGNLNLEKEFIPATLKCRGKRCSPLSPSTVSGSVPYSAKNTKNNAESNKTTTSGSKKSTSTKSSEGKSDGKKSSAQVKKTNSQQK
jgi:membrane-bound lytic murein transglycosylase D